MARQNRPHVRIQKMHIHRLVRPMRQHIIQLLCAARDNIHTSKFVERRERGRPQPEHIHLHALRAVGHDAAVNKTVAVQIFVRGIMVGQHKMLARFQKTHRLRRLMPQNKPLDRAMSGPVHPQSEPQPCCALGHLKGRVPVGDHHLMRYPLLVVVQEKHDPIQVQTRCDLKVELQRPVGHHIRRAVVNILVQIGMGFARQGGGHDTIRPPKLPHH